MKDEKDVNNKLESSTTANLDEDIGNGAKEASDDDNENNHKDEDSIVEDRDKDSGHYDDIAEKVDRQSDEVPNTTSGENYFDDQHESSDNDDQHDSSDNEDSNLIEDNLKLKDDKVVV